MAREEKLRTGMLLSAQLIVLISVRKTSHKHNNKDLSRLRNSHLYLLVYKLGLVLFRYAFVRFWDSNKLGYVLFQIMLFCSFGKVTNWASLCFRVCFSAVLGK